MAYDEKKYNELKQQLDQMKEERTKQKEEQQKRKEQLNTVADSVLKELKSDGYDLAEIQTIGRRLITLVQEKKASTPAKKK